MAWPSFGKGSASVQEGDITTFFRTNDRGQLVIDKTFCTSYVDSNLKEHACVNYSVEGGEFSGWAAVIGVGTLAATIFGATN